MVSPVQGGTDVRYGVDGSAYTLLSIRLRAIQLSPVCAKSSRASLRSTPLLFSSLPFGSREVG